MVLEDHEDRDRRQKTTKGGTITSPLEMARAEKSTMCGILEHGFS